MGLFGNNNLGHWLGRSPASRERAETRAAWDAAELAWRASPLGGERHVFEISKEIALAVEEAATCRLPTSLLVEIAGAADRLLELEDVEPFIPAWDRIESDAAVAVNARQMIARRQQWAINYGRNMRLFRECLVGGFSAVIAGLPEKSLERWASHEDAFSIPLVSLIYDPADAIESLILATYDDDTLSFGLFERLRSQLVTNLLVASGFAPTANPHELAERLVMPARQKHMDATELARAYLAGTPLLDLFELPVPFQVSDELRFEHCHIIGGTGHGKTQLMQRMIHADLVAARTDGRSVVVIDSQGDLINKLVRLDLFSPDDPESLADRLVLIDPSDVEFPAALNLFDAHLARMGDYSPADRERVENGVIELYETFFGALLGAELTQKQGVIFRYLARLMLTIPGATIHTLMELMDDGKPFRRYMEQLPGSARYFFEKEFFHPSFSATKKQILKRLWGVLSTPAFERMFAQQENKLDLFEATNGGAIVLVNTAKDLLKTEGSALFGRFFVAMLAQAALERSTLPEHRRTPTSVYVDEAQEYFDDTIETILSQARKYKMGITLAHQTLDQLSPRLRAAFLANTSFKCAGGVSARDARALAPEMRTSPEFIESMRRRGERTSFAVWLKHGTPGAIELSVPLGFVEGQSTLFEDQYDELIRRNRERYAGAFRIEEWRARALDEEAAPTPPASAPPAAKERPPVEPPTLPVELPNTPPPSPPAVPRELGKGGPKHRYLQALVKELGEAHGFHATVEAPLAGGGQADVLLERDGLRIAAEVSVTTPAAYERMNVRKCLDAEVDRVLVVLTKSRSSQERYQAVIVEGLSADEHARVSFVVPEDVPAYLAALAPPEPEETTVRGYKVRVSLTSVSPEDARERRERLAKLVSRSLRDS